MCSQSDDVYTSYVMERIQVLLDPGEKEQFRRLAQERGLSLSAWLREAALTRAVGESQALRLRSPRALRAFFAECDVREVGREPEWEEHLDVLETSKREGIGEQPRAAAGETTRGAAPKAAAGPKRKRR
jgi:hypothetical protein